MTENNHSLSKPRFTLGEEIFYVESTCSYGKSVPCTVCFGKKRVTVILGNGESILSECGYCSHGIDPPSGFSKTWEPMSTIYQGMVTGIKARDESWEYEVGSRGGIKESEAFSSREDARPLMESRLAEEQSRRATWERDNFITATKKQLWSVGYHRNQIVDHKGRIAWHEMRLCMIQIRSSNAESACEHGLPLSYRCTACHGSPKGGKS